MLIVLEFRNLRQEDLGFEASLEYLAASLYWANNETLSPKKKKKKRKGIIGIISIYFTN